jgi:TRAP-type mannitol/chloroaromatic compound transport system substrate-binding protein
MKKATFLTIALFLLGVAFVMVDQVQAQSFKWRMPTVRTPALTPFHESDLRFAEEIGKMTGGKFQITVHPAGELMGAFDVFDAVRKGGVEMASEWSSYWTGRNTAFDFYTSMGYMMHPADYITWLFQAGGVQLGQELYGKYGLMWFPNMLAGPESGFRTNKPIHTLADFKGILLRTGVLQTIWIMEQLGAKPMRIPGGEIYLALKMGTIDGGEFSLPSTDWGIKFQETTKYWVTPAGWHQPSSMGGVIINMNSWKKLPKEYQAVLENAAISNMIWCYAKGNWDCVAAVENFKKAGTQFSELNQEAQDKLEELCVKFMEVESAKNPDYAKIAKSIVNYVKKMDQLKKVEGPFRSGYIMKRYPEIK